MHTDDLRLKIGIYVIVLLIGFMLLDVLGLRSIYSLVKSAEIDELALMHVQSLLFKMFMLKGLWLLITIGMGLGLGYWVVKPYLKPDQNSRKDTDEGRKA